jgi:hypothetical protein
MGAIGYAQKHVGENKAIWNMGQIMCLIEPNGDRG